MGNSEIRKTVVFKGIGVSPGIVSGKAHLYNCQDMQTPLFKVATQKLQAQEVKRFKESLKVSGQELLDIKEKINAKEGLEPLFIDVHIMIIKDRMFIREVVQNIRERKINAEWALKLTLSKYRKIFNKMEDEYLRERIKDLEYVCERILRNLSGRKCEKISDINEDVRRKLQQKVFLPMGLNPAACFRDIRDSRSMASRSFSGWRNISSMAPRIPLSCEEIISKALPSMDAW